MIQQVGGFVQNPKQEAMHLNFLQFIIPQYACLRAHQGVDRPSIRS